MSPRARLLIPLLVGGLALSVLLGWALSLSWLTSFGGPVPMVPVTVEEIATS